MDELIARFEVIPRTCIDCAPDAGNNLQSSGGWNPPGRQFQEADPSASIGAKCAPNYAQDDKRVSRASRVVASQQVSVFVARAAFRLVI